MTRPPHHLLSPTPGARGFNNNDHTALDSETSPLGDYLAEAERSFESLGPPLAMDPVDMDRDATVRRKRPRSSRTSVSPHGNSTASASGSRGMLPPDARFVRTPSPTPVPPPPAHALDVSHAGPSRLGALESPARIASSHPSPSPSPSRHGAAPEHDEFAERFRYLIASSGLLEKTQLASLGSPWPSLDDALSHDPLPAADDTGPPEAESFVTQRWLMWDIITAAVVLAASIAYMVSPTVPVVLAAALLAGGALYWRRLVPEQPEEAPREAGVEATSPTEPEVPEKEEATTGRARVMDRLQTLLTESKNLDRCIASALQMLAPRPDDPEYAHELRIALHRLFEDMTDSLAGATSSLTPMCDRSELAVLGEMYDVQLTPGQRRRRESSSDEEVKSPSPVKMFHRRASSTSAAFAELPRPTLLSPRFARTPIRGGLGALAASPIDANDRFTQLPVRSRSRHQRASSEWSPRASPMYRSPMVPDVRHHDVDEYSDGVMSATSTESSSVPPSIPDDRMGALGGMLSPPSTKASPFTPKRASPLVQSLARLDMGDNAMSPPFPVMNTKPSQSPFRRSLQQMPYIPSPAVSSHEKAQSLAVARATTSMSSDKRRSLQTPFNGGNIAVDFARDQAILATGANLTRARSLPHSEKAKVRPSTASQHGSPEDRNPDAAEHPGLKRLSLLSDSTSVSSPLPKRLGDAMPLVDRMALGHGAAPLRAPHPTRVPSVSPLTAGGLKSSCLGVHLKRRRMVCCLLGLKLCEAEDSAYWDDVSGILQNVTDAMAAALARLDVLRNEAERECAAAQAIADAAAGAGSRSTTPPPRFSSYLRSGHNFAPRDSAEQALLASMDDMQRTLARLWARCDEVRVASGEGTTDFSAIWADMRNDIGGMLRHVDRNRLRLENADSGGEDGDDMRAREETPVPSHMPDFVRAWGDGAELASGPEEIERLVDVGDADDEHNTPLVDQLPPPGTDEVYEATTAPETGERARSTLSRDERIQLQREARARGMTFAQLEGSKDPARAAEIERQIEAARLRAVSGDMVQELEGMFGAIRRRKGMSGGDRDGDGDNGVGNDCAAASLDM